MHLSKRIAKLEANSNKSEWIMLSVDNVPKSAYDLHSDARVENTDNLNREAFLNLVKQETGYDLRKHLADTKCINYQIL